MKKILIAGTTSGSGKTSVTLGILTALSKYFTIQPYKIGPDYIDTKFHSRITGRKSINIDNFLVPDKQVLTYLFLRNTNKIDLGLVEGVMGLYDGLGINKDAYSTASIAKILKIPTILVVDGHASSTSIAAVIKGFMDFDKKTPIAGVIINKVMSKTHFKLIKGAIQYYLNLPVLGYLPFKKDLTLPSRQLGLLPDNEIPGVERKIFRLGKLTRQNINLKKLIRLATSANGPLTNPFIPKKVCFCLGIAYDKAFNFYYADNLSLLKEAGVKIKFFSPLYDDHLPQVDALYIGGGYPEEFAGQLTNNFQIRREIKDFSLSDKPIYAECGGLMYLGKKFISKQKSYEMVGVFGGFSKMTPNLKKFGYYKAIAKQNLLLAPKGSAIRGHGFHHSIFVPDIKKNRPVLDLQKIRDKKIVDQWEDGYQVRQTFASYLHVHFYQNLPLFNRFLLNLRGKICR